MENITKFEGLIPKITGKIGAIGTELEVPNYLGVYDKKIKNIPENNEFWYKTNDGQEATTFNMQKVKTTDSSEAGYLSQELINEWYVMKFEKPIAIIESDFLCDDSTVTNIYLSNSVTENSDSMAFNRVWRVSTIHCNNIAYSVPSGGNVDVKLGNGVYKEFLLRMI